MIGGVAALLAPMPFLFYWKGEAIRRRSKFAPTDEKPKVEDNGADNKTLREGSESESREKDDTARSRQPRSSSETDVPSFRSEEVEAGREGARVDDAELRTATGEVIESEQDLERHQRHQKETR